MTLGGTQAKLQAIACSWLGVSAVFLTDNAHPSAGEAPMREHLADLIEDDFVHYTADATDGIMLLARWRCVNAARGRYDWMAFIDLDEFVVLPGECATPTLLPACAPQARAGWQAGRLAGGQGTLAARRCTAQRCL